MQKRSPGSGPHRHTPGKPNRKKSPGSRQEKLSGKKERESSENRGTGEKRPFHSRQEWVPVKRRHAETPQASLSSGSPLNKYIAHCGICSRRKAVDFIKAGQVTVNGKAVTEPGYKTEPKDVIKLNGKKISVQQKFVYILLNKPKGFITTTEDPEGRRTVMELVTGATDEARIYPVGRLDRNTSGLLLLTNDGELAQKLAHPGNRIKKVYHVGLDKPLSKTDFDKILTGVKLEDGVATVDALAYVDAKDKTQVGLEIHIGRNRIVRRLFEHLDYKVEKLDRVLYAGLTKKNIPRGKYRFLTEKEVILLKHFK